MKEKNEEKKTKKMNRIFLFLEKTAMKGVGSAKLEKSLNCRNRSELILFGKQKKFDLT